SLPRRRSRRTIERASPAARFAADCHRNYNKQKAGNRMRLAKPRVEPVDLENLTPEQKELLAPIIARGRVLNIFRTLVNKPKAAKRFMVWANYVLSERNDLPPREREIVILRIGYLCKSGYEWGQHVEIAKRSGLNVDEIARVKQGAGAAGWTEAEALLVKA